MTVFKFWRSVAVKPHTISVEISVVDEARHRIVLLWFTSKPGKSGNKRGELRSPPRSWRFNERRTWQLPAGERNVHSIKEILYS
jgi:hypothetical protein